MFEVGRVVYKIAGRDSNKVGVIVEVVDDRFVVVDGETRRKKVNVAHIEPTSKTVSLGKNASTSDVRAALEKAGFELDKKGTARKTPARKVAAKAVKAKPQTEAKPAKKVEAKAAPAPKAEAKPAEKKTDAKTAQ